MLALLLNPRKADPDCSAGPVKQLPLTRSPKNTHQSLSRMRLYTVVDVFWATGHRPHRCELDFETVPVRLDLNETADVGKQQGLELVRLNVSEEPILTAGRFSHDGLVDPALDRAGACEGSNKPRASSYPGKSFLMA